MSYLRWLKYAEIKRDNLFEMRLFVELEGEKDAAEDENLEGDRKEGEGGSVEFCRRQSTGEEEDAGVLGAIQFLVDWL